MHGEPHVSAPGTEDVLGNDPKSVAFEEQRRTLLGIAYRMLGSVADAEDVVQDAWMRWSQATTEVENARAYLARTVTNLSLNRLRAVATRKETYVGPWLPEPLVSRPDMADDLEMAESVSFALLVVLETLSPLERAVFVLHEVFGFTYPEIADMLDRSEIAVRQTCSRSRSHVEARRPRFEASHDVRRRVTEEFAAACMGGDLNRMLELLAPDVTAWTDGGGKAKAALRPIRGANKVARWLLAVPQRLGAGVRAELVSVNGQPGILAADHGVPDSVACFDVADARIVAVWLVRNPDKLRHLRDL